MVRRLWTVSLAIAALVTGIAAGAPTGVPATGVPAPSPPPAAAGRPAETAPYTYGEVYSVEMVLVPVAVRGEKAGERIGKDRFSLSVDGRPVGIESFESDTGAPLSLVFLQDLSGSMAEPGKL